MSSDVTNPYEDAHPATNGIGAKINNHVDVFYNLLAEEASPDDSPPDGGKPIGAPAGGKPSSPAHRVTFQPEHFPPELKALSQWVCWRQEPRDGKLTKVPYSPRTGRHASATHPDTWGTYAEACARLNQEPSLSGLGFVFTAADPYCGIDLDKCLDPLSGVLEPWALDIVQTLASYTEASPSGKGLHILVRGKLPPGGRRKGPLEMYDSGRFFTMTGQHREGTPTTVEERQAALEGLHARTFRTAASDPRPAASDPRPAANDPLAAGEHALSPEETALLDRARRARNGDKFTALWAGQWEGRYASQSEADQALCNLLAFWTGKDLVRMDRLFRHSGLYRDKWDRRHYGDGRTYGQATLDRAIQATQEVYQGGHEAEVQDLHGRPVIPWVEGRLPAIVDAAERALLESGEPLYQRAGLLVRPMQQAPTILHGVHQRGGWVLNTVDRFWLAERLSAVATWLKPQEGDGGWRPINAPRLVAETYLSRRGAWKLPPLTAITETPTLRPDGSVLDTPGYDKATGLLFDPGSLSFGPIPLQPTRQEAEAALVRLREPLQGFPFEQAQDESVALSAFLTALIRRSLRTAPLVLIDAPTPGTGKSLLVDAVALVATGRPAPVMSQAGDPAEERKRFLALLMEGSLMVCIDNVERPLGGDTLCTILTQTTWKDRQLGTNITVEVPTHALFMATGNNVQVVGDLTRRVLPCRLDAQVERPQERRFKLNLYEYLPRHRGELVRAGLTILRAYHVAGRPQSGALRPFGGFEEWSSWIRGALLWLDLPDPLETQRKLEEADPVRGVLGTMLSAWHQALGEQALSLKEAIDFAQKSQEEAKALLEAMEATGRHSQTHGLVIINPQALGKWLAKHAGRIQEGLRFEKAGERQRAILWRVVKA